MIEKKHMDFGKGDKCRKIIPLNEQWIFLKPEATQIGKLMESKPC